MGFDNLKKGKILIEIRVLNPEKILNEFWVNGIKIYKIKKKNITTLLLEVDYINYYSIEDIIINSGGKVKIIQGKGFIFFLGDIKKRITLAIGIMIFIVLIYCMSSFIWAIEIEVGNNIAPFDIRQQLSEIGITPGIKKNNVDVTAIEKKLENINSQILWLRVRIEGSTLRIVINEKINPPAQAEKQYGNLISVKEGEIQKIYTFSGVAKVKPGQVVKTGDVLIEGIDGEETEKYLVEPKGVVIANVFYEKEMKIQVSGNDLVRSGEKDEDIYIKVAGKKIYLKKALNNFKYCDKIEDSGKIFNKVLYYEKTEKNISLTDSQVQSLALTTLEESLQKDLSREAKIVNKIITKEKIDDEFIKVKIVFVVEENIISNTPISY